MRSHWAWRAEQAYWVVLSYVPLWVVRLMPRWWRQRRVRRFIEQVMNPPPEPPA
jgi:hypothetical protein